MRGAGRFPARAPLLNDGDRAVIVAVAAMRMVQMPVHQIIDVIAVRHGRMTAAGTMHMPGFVPAALMIGRTPVRIR